jgi:enoyl-CoA hydratase/carnithine racemase
MAALHRINLVGSMVRTKDGVLTSGQGAERTDRDHFLNRPERLNSFNSDLRKALHETYWEFAHDDEAWVAILTANGCAFDSGQDLRERADLNQAELDGKPGPMVEMPDYLQNILPLAEWLNCWKQMISAVNGIAVAGGFNHAM